MLRALARFLGTGVPVIGVNFGRVGFLSLDPARPTSRPASRACSPASTGSRSCRRSTSRSGDERRGRRQRRRRRERALGPDGRSSSGRSAARTSAGSACDGVVCATPVRLDGLQPLERRAGARVGASTRWRVTFVAPHSLHARPLVVPRGRELIVWNRTADVAATVLVDGHAVGELPPGGRAVARVGAEPVAARDAARGDVLQPLPPDLCFVGSASRTSS